MPITTINASVQIPLMAEGSGHNVVSSTPRHDRFDFIDLIFGVLTPLSAIFQLSDTQD
jgi:hypothetical protein